MAIDADPLTVALALSKRELDTGVEQALAEATVAGVLSLLPGVGSAIQSLIDGKAQRNVERRWVQLFADLKEHIDAIRDTIPDNAYYGSEEFQTLLALAYEQLLTTHDRAKLKMLATGLANSGSTTFEKTDKELCIRTLRNITVTELRFLSKEALANWVRYDKPAEDEWAGDMNVFARLLGFGLVRERSIPASFDGGYTRLFKRSEFGGAFLAFVQVESPHE